MLNYEKLDVYRCSLEFCALAFRLMDNLGRGDAEIKDQLKRAALSIPLNIAESSGKISDNDRARFLAIARGSAMECGAVMDCVKIMHPGLVETVEKGKILIERVVEMLSKMCRPG